MFHNDVDYSPFQRTQPIYDIVQIVEGMTLFDRLIELADWFNSCD